MNGTVPVAFGAEPAVIWDELRGQSLILRMVLTRGGLPERGDAAKDPRSGFWERKTVGDRGIEAHRGQEPWEKGGLVEPRGNPIRRAVGWKIICRNSDIAFCVHRLLGPDRRGGRLQLGWGKQEPVIDARQAEFQAGAGLMVAPGGQGRFSALTIRTGCHCGGDILEFLAQRGQLLQGNAAGHLGMGTGSGLHVGVGGGGVDTLSQACSG